LAQVIVQSEREDSGTFLLRATAPGLKPAEAAIRVTAAAAPPSVENPSSAMVLANWMQSPVSNQPMDPNAKVADNDMNTWTSVQAGVAQSFSGGTWSLLRCQFTPDAAIARKGGSIRFKEITGSAEVFIDGISVAKKTDPKAAALTVPLPPKDGLRTLSVRVDSQGMDKAGLTGTVGIEAKP
jgi:beta-galactosidase